MLAFLAYNIINYKESLERDKEENPDIELTPKNPENNNTTVQEI